MRFLLEKHAKSRSYTGIGYSTGSAAGRVKCNESASNLYDYAPRLTLDLVEIKKNWPMPADEELNVALKKNRPGKRMKKIHIFGMHGSWQRNDS